MSRHDAQDYNTNPPFDDDDARALATDPAYLRWIEERHGDTVASQGALTEKELDDVNPF